MSLTDLHLLYAAAARCRCGAGLAYESGRDHFSRKRFPGQAAWSCSSALKGEVGDGTVHDSLPWMLYKVREETSINNREKATTRPLGTVALTVGKAVCPICDKSWESEPYSACGLSHHWFSGPCPGCGYAVGAAGSHSSEEGPAIKVRYRDVFLSMETAPAAPPSPDPASDKGEP